MSVNANHKGLIQLYHGDGKGKTSAAVGAAVRAAGAGFKVCFVQLNKDGSSSELKILRTLPGVKVISGKPTNLFTWQMSETQLEEAKESNNAHFIAGMNCAREGFEMVVFDELCSAYNLDLIDKDVVTRELTARPPSVEIVLTGRDPARELIDLADYISEIRMVRHPYEKKIEARHGIEY